MRCGCVCEELLRECCGRRYVCECDVVVCVRYGGVCE